MAKKDINIRKTLKAKFRGRKGIVDGFFLVGDELPGWELIRKRPLREKEGVRTASYIYKSADPVHLGKRLKVETVETPTREEAIDYSEKILRHTVAAHLMVPSADYGEFGFINGKTKKEGGILDYLTFTRANITFKFSSIGEERISVKELAESIDAMFDEAKAESANAETGLDLTFTPSANPVSRGDEVRLEYGHDGDPDLKVWYMLGANTENCNIFRREGVCYFVPEQRGRIDLLLVSFSPEYGRSVAEFTLRVRG